jgi:hypothetical protein
MERGKKGKETKTSRKRKRLRLGESERRAAGSLAT